MEDINEAWGYYKQFINVFTQSAHNTQHTESFICELHELLNSFSLKLQQLIDKYSDGFFETDQGRLLGGSLSKIAASYKSLSMQLKNEVLEPFIMFMENFKTTIEAVAKKTSDSLTQLEIQKAVQVKIQTTYYQSSLKMLRSKQDIEKAIEKIQKGGKNADLIKANEVSMKLRIVVDENERDYKECISETNTHWKKALKELSTLQGMVDYNEQSRLSFTKNTTNAMLRLIVQEWPIPDKQQIQQTLSRRDSQKSQVHPLEVKLDKFITNDKKQHFVSYDESNRKQIKKNESNEGESRVTSIDVDNINQLLDVWLTAKEATLNESLDRIRVLIISSQPHSCCFVESLYRRVQLMPGYYCKLEEEHFNQVQNIFLLMARCVGSQNPETMWKLMNVSMRLMKRKKDKNNTGLRELICSQLGKHKEFQDEKLWQSVWQHIRERSLKESAQQQSGWGSLLAQGWRGLNNLMWNSKPTKEEDQVKTVQQVAILMSSLCLPSQFCFPVAKKMMESIGEGESLELLKDHLYSKQDIQLRQKLTNFKEKALAKQQKYMDLIGSRRMAPYVLNLVAKRGYLNVDDINLRLVCQRLKNVHRVILYQLDHVDHKYQRLIDAHSQDYIRMKHEVAENSCPSSIEQIISLDVNRSLHIHAEYLPPTLLHTLLRTFAYYNKQIGYCQGMNYLAGYVFIKTRNEQQAYLVFEKIMKDRFWSVFVNEFEALKLKMYQFDRLLNIFLPDLADHFKRQMVSPECYIVPWVIALFSSTYQYTKESYVVDLLWLRFMVWGWREFFKFVLWLLAKSKDELIELSFDRVLHLLGETLRSELLTSSRQKLSQQLSAREFGEQLDRYRITNGLLQKLEKEYKMSIEE